jgi:hypothetical protein
MPPRMVMKSRRLMEPLGVSGLRRLRLNDTTRRHGSLGSRNGVRGQKCNQLFGGILHFAGVPPGWPDLPDARHCGDRHCGDHRNQHLQGTLL